MEYIDTQRNGDSGDNKNSQRKSVKAKDIAGQLNKKNEFISAANRFNDLPEKEQLEIKQWYGNI